MKEGLRDRREQAVQRASKRSSTRKKIVHGKEATFKQLMADIFPELVRGTLILEH